MSSFLPPIMEFSTELNRIINNTKGRIQNRPVARYLWTMVLTEDDRKRLDNDYYTAIDGHGPIGMWMKLRGVTQAQAIVEVAKKARLIDDTEYKTRLCEIGVLHRTIEETIQHAIASGDLVLVEQGRTVNWMKEEIDVLWYQREALWNFFFEVCLAAKRGRSVDHTTFAPGKRMEDAIQPSYPAKTKSQLIKTPGFPKTLASLFKPAGRHSLKLDLAPDKIRLYRIRSCDILEELF